MNWNASFTTCDLPQPHYRVTASDILLYPQYGWMVAYWGYLLAGAVPIVPMPTYIYDFEAAEKAQKNLPPFPEVGDNRTTAVISVRPSPGTCGGNFPALTA